MRYSLSSRFSGTLIGSAIAATLNNKSQQNISSRMAIVVAKSLIQLGKLDLENLNTIFAKDFLISEFLSQAPIKCEATTIIATLPIALFYHENELKLRQNLLAFIDSWQHNAVMQDATLAVGYAIAQSLTQKLNAANLIPQIITFLGSQTQLTQHLAQVQTLLEQKAGLERVITELGQDDQFSSSIAFSFYCFLSTLEDWQLSVMRVAKSNYQMAMPEIVLILTGALSGTYNSIAGIPATLRMALSQPENQVLTTWGINSEAEILEICDALVAAWSGVYDSTIYPHDVIRGSAIAAPYVIKTR